MSSFVDLYRATYLKAGAGSRLNYLSAKYKNIKFQLAPSMRYTVTIEDVANAPGLAFSIYGDKDYWWVICQFCGIINPITEFAPGTVLDLPSLSDINLFLTSSGQSSSTSVTI